MLSGSRDARATLIGGARGALVVLLPSYRRPEAEAVLTSVRSTAEESNASTRSLSTAVLAWDELLGVCDAAAEELPADEREPSSVTFASFERCAGP